MLSTKNKTWVEISRSALFYNFQTLQKIVGKKVKVALVVKANAYGHGLAEVVSILKNKTDIFAVDNIDEAFIIRKIDKTVKVLILGYTTKENIKLTIENNFSFVVYSLDILRYIISLKLRKKAKIHIKIETGLNRQGVEGKDLIKILSFVKKNADRIFLEGVYTHFANVEDTLDSSFAQKQLKRFKDALKIVRTWGFNPPLIHTAASAASFLYKESHFSMIRAGVALYGLWPSRETRIALKSKNKNISLKPVLTWKSIVAQVKIVRKGESVGYGRTWISEQTSKIAVIPAGYSDGFDRKLSNLGRVIVGGSYAPVIGRVAMNMIMVDITHIKGVNEGDEVVIIGKMGKLEVTADELAEKIGTINYEVISRINPILPRIIV